MSTKLPVSVEPDESNLDDNNHLEGFDILDEVKDEGADETGKKVDKKKNYYYQRRTILNIQIQVDEIIPAF